MFRMRILAFDVGIRNLGLADIVVEDDHKFIINSLKLIDLLSNLQIIPYGTPCRAQGCEERSLQVFSKDLGNKLEEGLCKRHSAYKKVSGKRLPQGIPRVYSVVSLPRARAVALSIDSKYGPLEAKLKSNPRGKCIPKENLMGNLIILLDGLFPSLGEIDKVVIERQHEKRVRGKIKAVEDFLYAYFLMNYKKQ